MSSNPHQQIRISNNSSEDNSQHISDHEGSNILGLSLLSECFADSSLSTGHEQVLEYPENLDVGQGSYQETVQGIKI